MKRENKIYKIMIKVIKFNPTSWEKIMIAVSNEVKISNWMEVRNILQYMINERKIKRTSDLRKEFYETIKGDKDENKKFSNEKEW